MVTPFENQSRINKLTEKMEQCQESHQKTDVDIAKSIGSIEGTILSMHSTVKELVKDVADTKAIIPVVDIIASEIKTIRAQQEEISKFRWKIDGGKYILAIVISAAVTISGLVFGWTEFKSRFVAKRDVNVYKLIEYKNAKDALCKQAEYKDSQECEDYNEAFLGNEK